MLEKDKVVKKATNPYFSSLLFLVLVLVLTGAITFYNSILEKETLELRAQTQLYDQNIAEIEKEKKIQIFALLQANKKTMNSLEGRSQITKIINHIDFIQEKYHIRLIGFNLSSGKLETKALVESNETGIAYQKVGHFVKEYRKDSEALFELGFVDHVSGGENSMKFNVSFSLKQ
ncbi:hypothetical protein A9Q91_00820 [Candidatus Gracilibacteria bacterium 28_42_T64]|nr:hypothetical protein A9Q91_00820 [Candidatus Gracilibacteria bacterium 28_42_T64]